MTKLIVSIPVRFVVCWMAGSAAGFFDKAVSPTDSVLVVTAHGFAAILAAWMVVGLPIATLALIRSKPHD